MGTADRISEGDLVIVYFSKEQLVPAIVESGKETNSRYGQYPHDRMVGTPFGSKVASKNGKGFAYLLKPTPELWTLALPHRTQILYMPDIAFITSYLNISPGQRVIEAGTGSGSFSHSVARNIGLAGKLFSFEFHEERFKAAREEFEKHALPQITIEHRNVCKDGFPNTLDNSIDSIFLDLPAPWEAVAAAKKALRKDRPARVCCFSPCIEQVLRTVTVLGSTGFSEITMYEALVRHHDVVINEPPATIFDVMSRIKSVESHKEARRLRQIERAAQVKQPTPTADAEESTSSLKKRSADEIAPETEQSNKRPHVNQSEASTSQGGQSDGPTAADKAYQALDPKVARPQTNLRTKITRGTTMSETAFIQSRALPQTRGHTSYLTFATLLPTARNGGSSAAESNQTAAGSKSAEQEAVPQSQHQELSGDAAESAATSVADPQQKASELPDGLTTASRQKLTREESDALVEGVSFGTPEDVSFSL